MSNYNRDNNNLVWFDLPVKNLERASRFYQAVLNRNVEIQQFEEMTFAVIEHQDGNGGCLIIAPDLVTEQGPLIYLNVHGRIEDAVNQVEDNGGKILMDIHPIGPYGKRAVILDSEGGRVALHSEE